MQNVIIVVALLFTLIPPLWQEKALRRWAEMEPGNDPDKELFGAYFLAWIGSVTCTVMGGVATHYLLMSFGLLPHWTTQPIPSSLNEGIVLAVGGLALDFVCFGFIGKFTASMEPWVRNAPCD